MPRKIVSLITPSFTPDVSSAAQRMDAAAKALSASYTVHVFTFADSNSEIVNHSVKCDENLTIHYVSIRKYNKSNFLLRTFFEIWYSYKLLRRANRVKCDLVIVSIPFMFLLKLVVRNSNAKNKIVDIRDLSWLNKNAKEFFIKKISKRLAGNSQKCLALYDHVIVTNEHEMRWLLKMTTIPGSKILIIPNGISRGKIKKLKEVKYTTNEQRYTITYIGNIGSDQNLFSIINAVKGMRGVWLNIIGDGISLAALREYVSKNKISNVSLPGQLKWTRVIPYYQTSDLLFDTLTENCDTAIPAKLYEYLATGLPVLFQGRGTAAAFLITYKNTFVTSYNDSAALEKLIWRIKSLVPERSENNARLIGSRFIREKQSIHFAEICAKLLNEKAPSNVFVEDILLGAEH